MALEINASFVQHVSYEDNIAKWNLIKAVLDGKEAIDDGQETYLPKPSGRTDSEYENYQKRAVLYNATARTLEGLLGAIFRKQPKIILPKELEYLKEDTDGEGNDIIQFSKKATRSSISYGRHGLLVDFPVASHIRNLAEERAANLKARIHSYSPQSIVNWRVARVGGILKLTHVLLQESGLNVGNHPLEHNVFNRYRLLELDSTGRYVIRIMEPKVVPKPNGNKGETLSVITEVETLLPLLPNGERLDFIPFKFIGSVTNNTEIDKAPLYDLAHLNLAHYRNSADYEEALYMLGQPTPWITGLDDEFIENNQGSLRIGSRTAWLLPEGSEVGLLESKSEKNLLQKGMELKEAEMIGLGARLVQDNSVRGSESTESVLFRRSGEANQMSCIADNVSSAVRQAIEWVALWMGVKGDVTFILNTDFFTTRLTHQEIEALVTAWQGGAISHNVVLDNLRKGEVIDPLVTNEEVMSDIENESPSLSMEGVGIGAIDVNTEPADSTPD